MSVFSANFKGSLIGNIIDFGTSKRPDRSAYLIPLGLIYVFPCVLAVALFFIPESPRWLMLQDRVDDSRKSLTWLRPDNTDVTPEIEDIQTAIRKESELTKGVGILDMFSNPVDRRRTMIAVAGVTLQAATGSMFIIGESNQSRGFEEKMSPFPRASVSS